MGESIGQSKGVCLVVGAGVGVGSSIARAFAREGLTVCVTRRERHAAALDELVGEIRAAGGKAHGFPTDARSEDDVVALYDRIENEIGPLEVVVFNIGANVKFDIAETTTRIYTKVWEMAALAGFLNGREAARRMTPRGHGTIIFTGATASMRGGAGFSAFAGAKHALRALAQSMARELGPKGIHVGHIVVDASIDGQFARDTRPDVGQLLAEDRIVKPEALAENYVWLWKQPPSAWTHELDLRPWKESW